MFILNRSYTRSIDGKTPYEAWYGKKPAVHYLRVFSNIAYVKNARPGLKRLDDRSTKMIFIGYEEGSKAYRVYNPATKKVQITRDVVFEEGRPWTWSAQSAGAGMTTLATFSVVYTMAHGVHEMDSGTPTPTP